MINFIHDASGSIAEYLLYALAVSGLLIYFYRYTRKYIKIDRKTFVKYHLYGSLLTLPFFVIHYFTTDKSNFFLLISIPLFVLAGLAGVSLRFKKLKNGYFKKVIKFKIGLLVIALIITTLGHSIIEDDHKHEKSKTPVIEHII